MRVMLVTHRYPPDGIAGVERYTERLAAALLGEGQTVTVLTRRLLSRPHELELQRERDSRGLLIYRLTGGILDVENFLTDHARLERLFTIALIEAAPDVVQVNQLIGLSPRLVSIAQRLGTPVVLVIHDFYAACPLIHLQKRSGELCTGPDGGRECATTCFVNEPSPERWILRASYFGQLLAAFDSVVCGSARVREFFERFAPSAAPIKSVPFAGFAERRPVGARAEAGQGDERLRLAFLGSVVPHKGVDLIADAVRLAGIEAELTVFGRIYDPTYECLLRETAAGAPNLAFHLHGDYEPTELPTLLGGIDVVVVPSRVPEVVPLVPREALACGVPVLVGRLGGLPEVVVEGENGLTFDTSSPDELAAILRGLATDRSLLERLRHGARLTAVPSVEEHADAMRDLYEEVVEAAARRHGAVGRELEELERLHADLLGTSFAGSAGCSKA
jgi:glycosyltransferase involved in cell wall biosynthesis